MVDTGCSFLNNGRGQQNELLLSSVVSYKCMAHIHNLNICVVVNIQQINVFGYPNMTRDC